MSAISVSLHGALHLVPVRQPEPRLQVAADKKLQETVLNRLAVLEALCANQAQTIQSLQDEVASLHATFADQVLVTEVNAVCNKVLAGHKTMLVVTASLALTCGSCLQSGQCSVTEEHMQSTGLCPSTSGLEYAAHYAAQPPARLPYDVASVSRCSRAEQMPADGHAIAALHPRPRAKTSAGSLLPSRLLNLASPATALLPLQREQFVAKLPKACLPACPAF